MAMSAGTAKVGIDGLWLALVDPTTQKILTGKDGLVEGGVYSVTKKDWGVNEANISNLAGSVQKIYGSNVVQHSYTNPAAPTVTVKVNNFPVEIQRKLRGLVRAEGSIRYVQSDKQPEVALIARTSSLDNEANKHYWGFGAGNMSLTGANLQTDDASRKVVTDSMTYSANAVERWDNKTFAEYSSTDEGFTEDKLLADVFDGFTGTMKDVEKAMKEYGTEKKTENTPGGGGVTPTPGA